MTGEMVDTKKNFALLGLVASGLFGCIAVTLATVLAPTTNPLRRASQENSAAQALIAAPDIPVKSFKIDNANMAEALVKLRNSDISHIVIGFERIPHNKDENGGPITLEISDTTVREVVHHLCEADPRYEYKVIDGRNISRDLAGAMIVEVLPSTAAKDPNDLLNLRIKQYKVDARANGAIEAIERIDEDAPELRAVLQQKHEEWVKETGRQPGGSAGSIMSGNMPPPPFVLELHNVTVRQILNAISLKSIERFTEGKNYGPVGWQYDFVIDPNAPTGLGGYPEWKPL